MMILFFSDVLSLSTTFTIGIYRRVVLSISIRRISPHVHSYSVPVRSFVRSSIRPSVVLYHAMAHGHAMPYGHVMPHCHAWLLHIDFIAAVLRCTPTHLCVAVLRSVCLTCVLLSLCLLRCIVSLPRFFPSLRHCRLELFLCMDLLLLFLNALSWIWFSGTCVVLFTGKTH
jgi:hypothetical protein